MIKRLLPVAYLIVGLVVAGIHQYFAELGTLNRSPMASWMTARAR